MAKNAVMSAAFFMLLPKFGDASNLAFTELSSESNKYGNPHKQLEKVVDALSFDFSGLSGVCLPCNDAGYAVRTGAI
ncbi:hypothetical protein DR864_00005 [Runella rosea]|uniref:Uncharacterized protein n=2 Tax=Runella rosea TaxID=2259595 RepID=A0A344TRT3_9BACT|nr:hypothetical protein DR864_00005 [Runella rosea]